MEQSNFFEGITKISSTITNQFFYRVLCSLSEVLMPEELR